jgi:hypothetical protein
MMEIFLSVSIFLNIVLGLLIWILFNIRCKKCGKDKEIRQVIKNLCDKCEKEKNNKNTEKKPKNKVDIF